MPGKAKALTTVVKLGVKYGPVAYEAIKHGKEPAKEFAQKQLSKLTARKQALAHAEGLLDGSAMPVWDGDLQVWVVFNGDEAIASHPTVTTPLAQLIQGYDLSKRIRPTNDQRPKPGPLKGIRDRR
ncbi:MAG TPA: hypothetical protein VN712_10500 [Dermatophilaceae bacterium]|jgi:hypothetical protein|nr:hypothetical protein [Dermatophilaceae bacterium]